MLREFLLGGVSAYVVPGFPIPARDYYISLAGGGDGLTSGAPITLAEVMAASLHDGDNIYFKKGETYEISEWAISNVNDITVDSWGSGAKPILTGSLYRGDAVWTDQGSNQWSTPQASCKWVYRTGTAAKQAESAWIPVTVNVSAQVRRVLAATVNAFPDSIIGATMVGKEFNFRLSQELTVTNYNSGNGDITFTGILDGLAATMPIKLCNQRQFLSVNGDWCYVGGILYVRSTTSPSGTDIRVCAADFGISFEGCNGVTIGEIDFRHYYKYGFLGTTVPNLTFDATEFKYNRGNALRVTGINNVNLTIENTVVLRSGLRGIEINAVDGGYVGYNNISEIGVDDNMGRPFDFSKICGSGITRALPNFTGSAKVVNNVIFEYNIIHDTAYEGIGMWGNSNIIRKNKVYNYLMKYDDGGGIYVSYGNYLGLYSSTRFNTVEQNWVHDGVGSVEGISGGVLGGVIGIYCDNGAVDNTINNNFVVDPGVMGILLNFYTTRHTVTNNKVVGGSLENFRYREDNAGLSAYFDYAVMLNTVSTGNICVCKTTTARCVTLANQNNNNLFNPFTTLNNNHYVQPYTTNINRRTINSGGSYTELPLATWKTYTGLDAAATQYSNYKVTPVADDVVTTFNDTDVAVNFNIPGGHTDVYGNVPSNPYSIQPWEGLIYLKI